MQGLLYEVYVLGPAPSPTVDEWGRYQAHLQKRSPKQTPSPYVCIVLGVVECILAPEGEWGSGFPE